MVEHTSCPECGNPAEITWRHVLVGSDGPVEHAHVRCVARHWFLLPTGWLAGSARTTPPARAGVER